jgi:hypothetical protein
MSIAPAGHPAVPKPGNVLRCRSADHHSPPLETTTPIRATIAKINMLAMVTILDGVSVAIHRSYHRLATPTMHIEQKLTTI